MYGKQTPTYGFVKAGMIQFTKWLAMYYGAPPLPCRSCLRLVLLLLVVVLVLVLLWFLRWSWCWLVLCAAAAPCSRFCPDGPPPEYRNAVAAQALTAFAPTRSAQVATILTATPCRSST